MATLYNIQGKRWPCATFNLPVADEEEKKNHDTIFSRAFRKLSWVIMMTAWWWWWWWRCTLHYGTDNQRYATIFGLAFRAYNISRARGDSSLLKRWWWCFDTKGSLCINHLAKSQQMTQIDGRRTRQDSRGALILWRKFMLSATREDTMPSNRHKFNSSIKYGPHQLKTCYFLIIILHVRVK